MAAYKSTLFLLLAGLAVTSAFAAGVEPAPDRGVRLLMPTENRNLLSGDLDAFYQETEMHRTYGGHYGFVRSTEDGLHPSLFNKFHKGIDIRPLRRDAKGEPLDPVYAAAGGEVVYTNESPAKSNYGRYVMIQHDFPDGTAYTTYGHLAQIYTRTGYKVQAGDKIGLMGWSGNVGSRERAHLHFEFGFRIQPEYCAWAAKTGRKWGEPESNPHGEFNGLNFMGVDPAPILLATAKEKPLSFWKIFDSLHPVFRVRVPAGKDFFFWQKCWPWMVEGGLQQPLPASWDIECDGAGIPLKFIRSSEKVDKAVLLGFKGNLTAQESVTRGLVERQDGHRQLSRYGQSWFSQLTYLR